MRSFQLIIVIILLVPRLDAKGGDVKSIFKKAEKAFYQERFVEAMPLYSKIYKQDPTYVIANYKAEVCALLSTQRDRSLGHLVSFEKSFRKRYKFYDYWLGRIYLERYRFQDAINVWTRFLKENKDISEGLRMEVEDYIAWGKNVEQFYSDRKAYGIHQLEGKINSDKSELTPAFYVDNNELIYASNARSEKDKDQYLIYHTYKTGKYSWADPSVITSLGSFTGHQVNIEIVDKQSKLFLFKPDNGGGLYCTEKKNGAWVAPMEFKSRVKKSNLKSHFYINDNQDRIIFVSTRQGVHKDLFESIKDTTGSWSIPIAMGTTVNSEHDEESPYLAPDGKTLYFSSRGHNSIGGYDVFKVEYDIYTGEWGPAQNLGYPINTIDNETHFKINSTKTEGFLCSDRLGSNGDSDIYFFWETEEMDVEGQIVSQETNEPISDVSIQFRPKNLSEHRFREISNDKGAFETKITKDSEYIVEIIREEKVIHTENLVIDANADLTALKRTFYVKETSN